METTKLQAEVRELRGKGPARRLRAEGKLPAVFYGPGQEPIALTLDPKEVVAPLRGAFGRNSLFSVSVDGAEHLAMVRDLSVEPVSRELLHVDLLKVDVSRPITTKVPVRATGRAIGVVKGGKLQVARRVLPVRCVPTAIPAELVIDVTEIDMMQTFDVQDLNLPEGVEVLLPAVQTLAAVVEDKRAAREAEKKAAEEAKTAEA